jgi:hypothetical protein
LRAALRGGSRGVPAASHTTPLRTLSMTLAS